MAKEKSGGKLFPGDRTMQAYFDLLPQELQRQYLQSGIKAADVWDMHRHVEEMQRPKDR